MLYVQLGNDGKVDVLRRMRCITIFQEKVLDTLMNGCNRVINHVDEVFFFSIPVFQDLCCYTNNDI